MPTPQNGSWDTGSPSYIKPRGFLRSKFLIRIGSRFIQDSNRAVLDFGRPRGLFVLILTACEKIVRSYKDGLYTPSSQICAKSCNMWARQYNKNFDDRTDEWWKTTLACYTGTASESDSEGSERSIDETRDMLPRSSP